MDHVCRNYWQRIVFERLTDNVCNIARQDYEKVRTVGTIMAVKITGYLELIGIGGSASGAGLFLSLLRVQLAAKLGGGGTIYDTTQWRKGERQNIDGEYCVRGVQRCKERCSKSVRGTSIKTLFVADLIESVNLWRLIGTPDIWTGQSSIVVVGLIVEHRVYGSVNNFNILHEFYFIPFRCFFIFPRRTHANVHPSSILFGLRLYFYRVYIKFLFVTTITSRAFGNDLFFKNKNYTLHFHKLNSYTGQVHSFSINDLLFPLF